MNLFFGITVAPYSVDFCNCLHEELRCRMFHIPQPPFEMAFDVEAAERRCRFDFLFVHISLLLRFYIAIVIRS